MNEVNRIHVFKNGLALLGEEMDWCESVAFAFYLPAGTVYDPPRKKGLAGMTCEMSIRGAGALDNRAFLQALEDMGVETNERVTQSFIIYGGVMLPDKLERVLEMYADLVLRPMLPEEELEPVRLSQMQEVQSVEDDPARKMSLTLRQNFFPQPWGTPSFGDAEGVESITLDDIRGHYADYYRPNGAMLAVAGRFDWERIHDKVDRLFCDWRPNERVEPAESDDGVFRQHIPWESEQTSIGLAWPTLEFTHPDYLLAQGGVHVLSGGMSSRLFSEVREKRGLCYSVDAATNSVPGHAGTFCYCGTSTDRAQESLDVILSELRRLAAEGITPPELDRLKIMTKSMLIMQRESTAVRAAVMIRDWRYLGRIRGTGEIQAKVDALTCDAIGDYLRAHPAGPMRLVTVGGEPLEIDEKLLG